ncbi:asparagine synthase (glutamine-hydrolyzing) [Aminivibrio sp.]|uniref:asparagine synthase (glutamine-hydrolyzing) n=1 Tax=Aminivibrio sp. TaxID=1872489 RepID=UPI001A4EA3FA|nr:asparagine synthase (glutamine-hydrolyzing) [Aminivibrio sp.]MBL3538298.1 asparagine synthase (glutamine-hydrolyzing) [Aminivibrio sp.]
MCGICGLLNINSNANANASTIHFMANLLRHRGPDDEGYIAVSTHDGAVTPLGGEDSQLPLSDVARFDGYADLFLAHRRLSIIDLSSAGHQPMSFADGNLWVTYNGELYNYMELRAELEKCGHIFRTRTDTEVLLAAYAEWGEECLDCFDGMWAFVLYDKRRNLLFGSRDRFGVKPLYYLKNDALFAFASEAKAFASLPDFRRTVRSEAVFDYLAFGVERWDDGTTFLSEVMELPPAHAFRFDLAEKRLHVRRYYELPYHDGTVWEPFCEKKAAEHVERVRELVFASVRRHLSSDVPVGSCLSGGIDSSSIFGAIAAILKNERIAEVGDKPRAFTACYDDASIDESAWARLAAEHMGGEWHTVYPQGDELIADLEDLVYTQDFPFGSTSIYAQYRVMKLAKERGVTVLLDGQGGDELFTGYTPYYTAFFREMLGHGSWRDLAREWRGLENAPMGKKGVLKGMLIGVLKKHLPRSVKQMVYGRRNPLLKYISPELKGRHLGPALDRLAGSIYNRHSLNQMLFSLMSSTSLPSLLRYEDRNSMRFQIESRTPFADDRRMIEEVFAISSAYKIHGGFSKWLLRESMKQILPESIYRRQDKIGFATPEYAWLQPKSEHFRSLMDDNLSEYLDVAKIRREWSALIKKQPKQGILPIWRLLNVAMWAYQTLSSRTSCL